MNQKAASLLLIIAILSTTACSNYYEGFIKTILPADVDAFARTCMEEAIKNDVDNIIKRISPEDRNEGLRSEFQQLSKYMQKGELVKVTTAGVQTITAQGSTSYDITYELQYSRGWQVANFLLAKQGDNILLKGLQVNDLKDSLVVLNRFTFKDKTMMHYLFFVLNVIYLVVVGSSFVLCIRTKNLRRKWLWLIITLLGAIGFSFNWTTGAFEVNPLTFGFNISTFVSLFEYMPSILKFYVPVGAIVFLIKRRRMNTQKSADAPPPDQTIDLLPGANVE